MIKVWDGCAMLLCFYIPRANGSRTVHLKNRAHDSPWWRHQMETFSALMAISAGNSPVAGEFPAQRPVTRGFDAFFDLRLNKRLSKQLWGWWFETPSCSLWRQRNAYVFAVVMYWLRYPHPSKLRHRHYCDWPSAGEAALDNKENYS